MVELAFTHLGVFFKSGFKEAHFFCGSAFFLVLQFVLKLAFCGIHMLKVVF